MFPTPVAQPLKSISICLNRRGPRRFRVAQIGNLLFRRLAVGRRQRITNPRHSRLPVCATGVAVLARCAVAVNTYESLGYFRASLRDLDDWCVLIRSNNFSADSSFGSWGTSWPEKARARNEGLGKTDGVIWFMRTVNVSFCVRVACAVVQTFDYPVAT